MMPWGGIAWCALAGMASCGATLLIKQSHSHAGMMRFLVLGMALATYGIGFVTYALALKNLPVNLAYPVMTGFTMLCIALASALFLHEPLTLTKLLGMALIAAGAILVTR
jgi:multidrug transporter EmrE-like cation transporter